MCFIYTRVHYIVFPDTLWGIRERILARMSIHEAYIHESYTCTLNSHVPCSHTKHVFYLQTLARVLTFVPRFKHSLKKRTHNISTLGTIDTVKKATAFLTYIRQN